MKKTIIFIFLIFLIACNNPFKKYEDSVSELQKALDLVQGIEKEVGDIQSQIDRLSAPDTQSFTQADIAEIYSSLQTIDKNLDDPVVKAVLENYLEQNNISLDGDVNQLQQDLAAVPEFSNYNGTNPSKAEVTNLLGSLITKIQGM